ncbi:MAG: hypothetical protein U0271_04150 [Polyangiaceae bacterium]
MRTALTSLALFLASVGLLGCPVDDRTGRAVSTDDVPASAASADWQLGARDFTFDSDTPNDTVSCEAHYVGGQWCESTNPDVPLLDAYFQIECDVLDTSLPFDHFSIQVGNLDADIRTVDSSFDDGFGGFFWVHRRCSDQSCQVDNCYHDLNDAVSVHLSVLEEAGGVAAFPEVVTDDFKRVLSISFSGAHDGSGDAGNADHCDEDLTLSGAMTVTIDKASLAPVEGTCDDA